MLPAPPLPWPQPPPGRRRASIARPGLSAVAAYPPISRGDTPPSLPQGPSPAAAGVAASRRSCGDRNRTTSARWSASRRPTLPARRRRHPRPAGEAARRAAMARAPPAEGTRRADCLVARSHRRRRRCRRRAAAVTAAATSEPASAGRARPRPRCSGRGATHRPTSPARSRHPLHRRRHRLRRLLASCRPSSSARRLVSAAPATPSAATGPLSTSATESVRSRHRPTAATRPPL